VVVDTNILFPDLELTTAASRRLLNASEQGRVELAVPEVVVLECIRHFRRQRLSQHRRAALDGLRSLRHLGFDALPDEAQVDAAAEQHVNGYEARLRAMLASARARILPLPTVSHAELLTRALGERKPFKTTPPDGQRSKSTSDGYRDALIWASVVELCHEPGDASTVILLSANYKDFGYDGSQKLHEHLRTDLDPGWTASRVDSLEDLFALPAIATAIQAAVGSARTPSEQELEQLLRSPVEQACTDLVYTQPSDPAYLDAYGRVSNFETLPLPWRLVQAIEIESIDADLDRLSPRVVDALREGDLVVEVRIDAEVGFRGYMSKGDTYGLDDDGDVQVVDFDWNTHMSQVGFSRAVTLVFTAYVNSEQGEVYDVELTRAEPHDDAAHQATGLG
jgi:predicted nucleic acid-binding protein